MIKKIKNYFPAIMQEVFYFLSALLLLGACLEIFLPGIFILYFNVSGLAVGWLAAALILLFSAPIKKG